MNTEKVSGLHIDEQPLSSPFRNSLRQPVTDHASYQWRLHQLLQRQAETDRPSFPGKIQGDSRRGRPVCNGTVALPAPESVRAGMGDRPEAWEWSSYRDYIGQRSTPEWLRTGFILGYFGTDSSTAREKYRLFVEDLLGRKYESPLEQAVASAILGSEEFVAKIDREHLSDRRPDRNLPDLHTAATRVTVPRIREAMRIKFADDGNLTAKACIYLCHRHSGAGLREIGAQFGVGESTVSQTSRRFAQKMMVNGKLRERIDEVLIFLEVSRCRPDTVK